jgi:anhydro-N-acetylmuramic acid kinase
MLAKMYDPNLEHDPDGEIARKGTVLNALLSQLEALDYYTQLPPKSLESEWIENNVLPILNVSW